MPTGGRFHARAKIDAALQWALRLAFTEACITDISAPFVTRDRAGKSSYGAASKIVRKDDGL